MIHIWLYVYNVFGNIIKQFYVYNVFENIIKQA